MKTIEENAVLFEEARLLRNTLKQTLHQYANNIGYCSVKFSLDTKTGIHKRLIEQARQRKQRKLRRLRKK